MDKFFRSLRQKLLSDNRIRKYLLYAMGEIVLVVIGILAPEAAIDGEEDILNVIRPIKTYY